MVEKADEMTLLDEIAAMNALAAEAEHLERLSQILLVKVTEQRDRVERLIIGERGRKVGSDEV